MTRKFTILFLLTVSFTTGLNAQRLIAGKINPNTLPGYQFSDWVAFSPSASLLFLKAQTASGAYDMIALLLSGTDQQFNRKAEAGYEKGMAKEQTVAESILPVCDTLYYIRRGRDLKKDQETYYVQDMLKQLEFGKATMRLIDTVPYSLNRYEDITYCVSSDKRKTAIVSMRVTDKKDTVKGLHILIMDSMFRPIKKADIMLPVSPKSTMECKAVLTTNGTLYIWCSARKGLSNQLTHYIYRFDKDAVSPAPLTLPENAPDLKYFDNWIVRNDLVYMLFKPRIGQEGREYKLTGFKFENTSKPLRFDAVLSAKDFTPAASDNVIYAPRMLKAHIDINQQLIVVYDLINTKSEMSPAPPGQVGANINTYTAKGLCVIGFSSTGSEIFRTTLTRNQTYLNSNIPLSCAVSFQKDEMYIAWGNYDGVTLLSIYTSRLNYSGNILSSQTLPVPSSHSGMYMNGSVCSWDASSKRFGLITEGTARSNYAVLQIEY
jgi:hypothetical protein